MTMLQLLPPYTLAADGKATDGMLILAAICQIKKDNKEDEINGYEYRNSTEI